MKQKWKYGQKPKTESFIDRHMLNANRYNQTGPKSGDVIYGRISGRGKWHLFAMTGSAIGSTRCGKAFTMTTELSENCPKKGQFCDRCQRDQGLETK